MARRKWTTETVNGELERQGRTIRCVEYAGTVSAKSIWICEEEHEWEAPLSAVLVGKGCKACAINNLRLSTASINQKLKEQGRTIRCRYYAGITIDQASEWECLLDGHVWNGSWQPIRSGAGCKLCGRRSAAEKRIKWTLKKVNEYLRPLNIICLNYTKMCENSTFQCLLDGYVWTNTFDNIYRKHQGCRECYSQRRSSELSQWDINSVNHYLETKNISLRCVHYSGNVRDKSRFICTIDNKLWTTPWLSIYHLGCRCPHCRFKIKRTEKKIGDFLETRFTYFTTSSATKFYINMRLRKPDFHLPDYHALIEYDGQQHFMPVAFSGDKELAEEAFPDQNLKDAQLNQYVQDEDMSLLRIPYTRKDDIEKIVGTYLQLLETPDRLNEYRETFKDCYVYLATDKRVSNRKAHYSHLPEMYSHVDPATLIEEKNAVAA